MVRQVVLLLSIILITCTYQTMVKGKALCKIANVAGLVCMSYNKQLANRSAYELKHLSCAHTDEQRQTKGLKMEKRGQIGIKQYKQGRFLKITKKGGQQALTQADIFRTIQMLVAESCLGHSEDAVIHSNRRKTITTKKGKGYRKLELGKDTMYVKRHETKRSWAEAANVCHSENAKLAKIDTKQKMNETQRMVSDPKDQFKQFYMWIGLRSFGRNISFTWVDGSSLVFTHWNQEPHSNGTDGHCVALVWYVFRGVYWAHYPCSNKNGFLCERNKM